MSGSTSVPVNWTLTRLADLHSASVQTLHPQDHPDEEFDHYSIPAYQNSQRPIVMRGREILSQKILLESDCVLFGKLNPRVRKVWNVDALSSRRCVASTEWLPVVPVPAMDRDFLYFLSWSDWVMPIAQTLVTGSTPSRQRVNPQAFYAISVPVPPLEEQKRIAAVLREVDSARHRHTGLADQMSRIKRAAMRTLFERGVRGERRRDTEIGLVPSSWAIAAVGDVAVTTQYGLSTRGRPSGAYPLLRMNCQEDGTVHYRNLQFVDLDARTFGKFRLRPGDLLFNRTNSVDLVGRTAIVEENRPAVFASYLIRLLIDESKCLPHFLNYVMNWPEKQQQVRMLASRAVGQANISATKLRTVMFPLPPLDEQQEIVDVLGTLDRKINLLRRKRAVLDDLFKTLLQELMTGQIRVTDLDLSTR